MTSRTTIAITGVGVASSLGLDLSSFRNSVRSRRVGSSSTPEGFPLEKAGSAREFDTAGALGTKGTRTMDRTTALAVYSCGGALSQSGLKDRILPERLGMVMGTSTGSIRSASEFVAETWRQERPYLVNPALFPNTVMNCAAGSCAIWHKMAGPNSTIAAGSNSGILAMRYASLCLKLGYADALVVGAVEELCDQTGWAYAKGAVGGDPEGMFLGEGCACFALELESRDAPRTDAIGRILSSSVATVHDTGRFSSFQTALAKAVRDSLEQAEVLPSQVAGVVGLGAGGSRPDIVESRALRLAFGRTAVPPRIHAGDLLGDCLSAGNALQVLCALVEDWERPGPILLTSLDFSGQIAAMVVEVVVP